jgi:hypothetical protein
MARTSIERMAALGAEELTEDQIGHATTDPLAPAAKAKFAALALADRIEAEADRLRRSGHYSPEGLRTMLGDMGTRSLNELGRVRSGSLAEAQRVREDRREAFAVKVADGDGQISAALRAEMRGELRRRCGDDTLQIKTTAHDAVQKGDAATVGAILELSGSVFALLPEKDIAELRAAWAEKRGGLAATSLRYVERATAEAERAVDFAERRIRTACGLPADDPLAKAARGEAA